MMSSDQNIANVRERDVAVNAVVGATSAKTHRDERTCDAHPQRIALCPAGSVFGPEPSLALMVVLLAVGACFAPWFAHGWLWFGLVATAMTLLAGYDALALWRSRAECTPVLLLPEEGLRGREGQAIRVPLAIIGSARLSSPSVVRATLMPMTQENENAIHVNGSPQLLKLEPSDSAQQVSPSENIDSHVQLWPWSPEIGLLRRGLWPAPRVGTEKRSNFKIWRLRRWFDLPVPLRIEADVRRGRREILRSPIYRALVASRQTLWTGHGRDFERLREYQPGDNYAEIAWKSTARRSAPVTRLFQWEQKQEVYFVVDQSRASAGPVYSAMTSADGLPSTRSPRRLLDLSVETALVGATVALEMGDEFGLVTYADQPKTWLRAGTGQSHFHRFRNCLLNVEPLATNADYEVLFSEIRVRLRRRAYLLLLADLSERSISDSLRRGISLVRSSHAVLVTSILPAHARPAFSTDEEMLTDGDVYAALAGEKENQRLRALARQLRRMDVQLQFVPPAMFLRTAVESYLKNKREQRL
jgi:uncharacterized protein (DUF58 family)